MRYTESLRKRLTYLSYRELEKVYFEITKSARSKLVFYLFRIGRHEDICRIIKRYKNKINFWSYPFIEFLTDDICLLYTISYDLFNSLREEQQKKLISRINKKFLKLYRIENINIFKLLSYKTHVISGMINLQTALCNGAICVINNSIFDNNVYLYFEFGGRNFTKIKEYMSRKFFDEYYKSDVLLYERKK